MLLNCLNLPEYREYSSKPLFDEPGVHVDVLCEDLQGTIYKQLSFKLNYKKADLEKWQIVGKIENDLDLLDNVMNKIQQGCYTLDDHSLINTKNAFVQIKSMFKKEPERFDQIMRKYYAYQHDGFYFKYSLENFDELYEKYNYIVDEQFVEKIKKDPSWLYFREDEVDELYENIIKAYKNQILIGYMSKNFLHRCRENKSLFAIRDEDGKIWAAVVYLFTPNLEGPFSLSTIRYPNKHNKKYVFSYEMVINKYIKDLYKFNCAFGYRFNPVLLEAESLNEDVIKEKNHDLTWSYYLNEPLKFN